MLFSILISAGLLLADRPAESAEQPSDTLHAVTVTADKGVVISRTDTLHITNTFDITGELHQVPGLQLGDYGGFAGLKTVSLRYRRRSSGVCRDITDTFVSLYKTENRE